MKEFICVGCGSFTDKDFINHFYIEVRDKKFSYRIRTYEEVFERYLKIKKHEKGAFIIKLNLSNLKKYKIFQRLPVRYAEELDLRNIAKAKELELKRQFQAA